MATYPVKLVLYSGGQVAKNRNLHQALADLTDKKRKLSFTYIPFLAEEADHYFRRAIRRYEPYGFTRFKCLAVDQPYSKYDLQEALRSDVIYLAGGNTFYFLHHLRRAKLVGTLQKYARSGGVIAGLSAGAIICTPNIQLAGYPSFDRDENTVGLRDLRGLRLTNFEFFPHFESSPRMVRVIEHYSAKSPYPVFGVPDGGGLVVRGKVAAAFGRVSVFIQGVRISLAKPKS